MTEYDNTNKGALFKNHKRKSDKSPEYNGSINVGGIEYWLSGWVKTSQSGNKFFSLSLQPKEQEQPREQSISQQAMPKGPNSGRVIAAGGGRPTHVIPDDDMDGDRIPF